jgi:hypothetical protein
MLPVSTCFHAAGSTTPCPTALSKVLFERHFCALAYEKGIHIGELKGSSILNVELSRIVATV